MMTRKGGRMRSSTRLIPVTNMDRPRTYNAVADAVLQASKECESIALKWDALIDKNVNLNQRSINRLKGISVRRTTTEHRFPLFVNPMHPMWKKMQLGSTGQDQMIINGRPLTKSYPSFSKITWRELSEWNCILSLKSHTQCALITLELQRAKKTPCVQPIEDSVRRADLEPSKGSLRSGLKKYQRTECWWENNNQKWREEFLPFHERKTRGSGDKRKEKLGAILEKTHLNSPKNYSRWKKTESSTFRKRIWKRIFGKSTLTHSPTFLWVILMN